MEDTHGRRVVSGWWAGMPLDAWCGDEPQGTADLGFAHAVAYARIRQRRGVRQRVAVNRGEAYEGFRFVVMDVDHPRLTVVA